MSNELCKYYKICTCRCSGEADEVGEINELCNIGNLYSQLEKMKTIEEEINIINGNLKLNLVRTELCDDGWLDLTIENIENGRCTSYGIQEADILCALMPLIDTKWVLEGAEDEND